MGDRSSSLTTQLEWEFRESGFLFLGFRDFIMRHHLFLVLLLPLLCATGIGQSRPATESPGVRDHLNRAELALRTNDVETAEREFRAALALNPGNAEANTNLGVLAFARGDYQSACPD